jgi:hypothetical protein
MTSLVECPLMAERPTLYLPHFIRAQSTLDHILEVHGITPPTTNSELGKEPQRYHRRLHEGNFDKDALPHEHVLFGSDLERVTREFEVYPMLPDRLEIIDHLIDDHFVPENLPLSVFQSFSGLHKKLHRTEVQDHIHRNNGHKRKS